MTRVLTFAIALSAVHALVGPAVADVIVNDNGTSAGVNALNISSFATADDFTLAAPATISRIRFWASGLGTDMTSGGFSGTVGWAFHGNNAGAPGAVLYSGSDNSVSLTPDGTVVGFPQYYLDVDVPSVALGSGTYWLQLREGAIGSAYDGSDIFWSTSVNQQGAGALLDTDPQNPTTWSIPGSEDTAFQIYGPANAAAVVPEPSSFALFGLVMACGIGCYFYRRRILTPIAVE